MTSSISITVAITLGGMGLVALAGPARAGDAPRKAHAARVATATTPAPAEAAAATTATPVKAAAATTTAMPVKAAATTATPVKAAAATTAAPVKAAAAAPATMTPATPPAGTEEHCGLDDLGYDQLLAKRTEPRAAAPTADAPVADPLASAEAAADAFALGPRDHVVRRPAVEGEVEMKPHTLTPAVVGPIVADRLGDLYYCFMRIPKAERGDETFGLHLTIAPNGTVLDAGVSGGAHAARIRACVQAQARRWVFPQGDAPSEVDYPLSFSIAH